SGQHKARRFAIRGNASHRKCGRASGGKESSQTGTSFDSVLAPSLGGVRRASGAIKAFEADVGRLTVGSKAPKDDSSPNADRREGTNSEGRSVTGSCSCSH